MSPVLEQNVAFVRKDWKEDISGISQTIEKNFRKNTV